MLFASRFKASTATRFVAEAVAPDAGRRGLLAGACACAAFAALRPLAARAQSLPAPPPAPARPIHAVLDEAARGIEAKMIAWRRDIHAHPELGNQETRTAALVARHLKALGYEVREGVAVTGVVGVLAGEGGPGPVLALRADMDALPVAEQVDLPFASKARAPWGGETVGVMHACGHDCHVAMLMAAAEVLAAQRRQIRGTIKLIFQPAEEGLPVGEVGGARLMVEQGALADPKPDAVIGLHVMAGAPVGTVTYRAGPILSGSDTFRIVVRGRQTHGAQPWNGVDPITIGSTIVTTLQTIVSRETDIQRNPAVLTVGVFKGGVRHNIVPDEVELSGTLRTYGEEHRQRVRQRVGEIAEGVAKSMRGSAEVSWNPAVYPATINDAALVERMAPSLARACGAGGTLVRADFPASPSEDFSYFANVVPGLFFFVGIDPPGSRGAAPNHSPRFQVDEAGLAYGLRALLHLTADFTGSGAA